MGVRFVAALALTTTLAATLVSAQPTEYRWELPRGFVAPRVPVDNPMSDAKALLGRHLFYDTRMSVNGTQSCATCHRQELAFTDGRATAVGATEESHPRGAMSLVNVAYSAVLTWSNPSLRSLEKQALVPMLGEHPVELGLRGREADFIKMLRADPVYAVLFPRAFPPGSDAFTIDHVAHALAAFERTIISARSPYDRYYSGRDPSAISESAKRGEAVFFTDGLGGCFRCHAGNLFSDSASGEFHNTALYNLPGAFSYPRPSLGIFEHTRRPADVGRFKTPTLRNVALTAPYMHDGSVATLEEVLDHYAAGGRGHGNPNRDRRMNALTLTRQNRIDLLAFLDSLTDVEVTHDPRFSNPWPVSRARER